MTVTRGHCLCGSIAYEFNGEPKWVMHCHCSDCRRAVASPVATYVGVRTQHMRYVKGEPAAYQSSPGARRYFCATCGTPVAFTGDRWPGEVHLYHGTLTDPAQWPPTGHSYIKEQIPWFEVSDHLPRYEVTAGRGAKPVRSGPRSLS
jgi:hypothetical protein